jgi:hypothetical protein
VIIHQTLCNLFPLTSIPPSLTHPLDPAEFIRRILVPQVGHLLIQQDLGLSKEDALATMRKSARYGVAMFPYEDEGEGIKVTDRMMAERARKRREEVKIEERKNGSFERNLTPAAKGKGNRKERGERSGKTKGE